jgi:hypothetical protein
MATTANNWIAAFAAMTVVKYSANTSAPVIYSSAFNYTQVIPAKAGIHGHYNRQLDCGIRRNDAGEIFRIYHALVSWMRLLANYRQPHVLKILPI